jgi:hypothetical protein
MAVESKEIKDTISTEFDSAVGIYGVLVGSLIAELNFIDPVPTELCTILIFTV